MSAPAFGGHSAYRNDIHVVSRFLSFRHYGCFFVFNLCDTYASSDGVMGNYNHNMLFGQVCTCTCVCVCFVCVCVCAYVSNLCMYVCMCDRWCNLIHHTHRHRCSYSHTHILHIHTYIHTYRCCVSLLKTTRPPSCVKWCNFVSKLHDICWRTRATS